MHRFFVLVVAATIASTAALADDHARLLGTYALSGKSFCIRDPASVGFNPNFTPKGGPLKLFSFTVDGVMVLRANGTGMMNVQDFSVDPAEGRPASPPTSSPTRWAPMTSCCSRRCRARTATRS